MSFIRNTKQTGTNDISVLLNSVVATTASKFVGYTLDLIKLY